MGSKIYDFLTNSFLFDESLIREHFQSVAAIDIVNELQAYRQYCLSVTAELQQEVLSNTSNLKLFSGIKEVNLNLLKQSAFYVHQHVIYDPLFPLTETRTNESHVFAEFLGVGKNGFDKVELARILSSLKKLTPMIAANYVKLLPTSYFFEAPKEIPITYSEKGFSERVPDSLSSFFHQNAVVHSGKRDERGIYFDGSFEPGRIISIAFKEHGFEDSHGYVLNEMEVLERDDESGMAKIRMYTPDHVPDTKTFDAWVFQSVNQSAGRVYYRALVENSFASKFDASYLTNSPFMFELLKQIIPVKDDIPTKSINAVLNMDLPFLDDVDIEVLMKVRSEEGEAFEQFRTELDKQLREMRGIQDAETLKKKRENVIHELYEVQVPQLTRKITSLRNKFFAEAGIVGASLWGAIQSGGWWLPVALIAAFRGYSAGVEYQRPKKDNPAFFLWKVLKDSKKYH